MVTVTVIELLQPGNGQDGHAWVELGFGDHKLTVRADFGEDYQGNPGFRTFLRGERQEFDVRWEGDGQEAFVPVPKQ